ncbi:hypothetical protein [Qipengyuania sphaerica]|uniref:hypothetical protein n=1 Tax=Qipengyuania sphaerica TaxID=2867243 RepID=UPI001C873F26|nr:hypothetical protein [Qipengyuania sphaerica]MBX7539659.1 hypothetical protein [Qipengyuania sphaerica]
MSLGLLRYEQEALQSLQPRGKLGDDCIALCKHFGQIGVRAGLVLCSRGLGQAQRDNEKR